MRPPVHASALHRPGSVVGDALTALRAPECLGSWMHAGRLAELLASGPYAPHRAGKATRQIANELRSKLLPRARAGRYPDIEVMPGSLVRAIALPSSGAPASAEGERPLSIHERLQGLIARHHLDRGDVVYLPAGDRGRHPDLRARLTRDLPNLGQAAAQGSLEQVDVAVIRAGRLYRLYEIEMDAGKATKALVRLSDVLAVAGEPGGGLIVVTPDAQAGRLLAELERPTLRSLRGRCLVLRQSIVEDPFAARPEPN